jgi:hypothetical protein
LKQTDAAYLTLGAQIEPMPSAAGNAKQVSGPDLDGHDRTVLWTDVKDAPTLNDETDLVFVVPMLAVELVQHGIEARRGRTDVDDIGGDIASGCLEPLDLIRVCVQDLVLGGIGRDGV